MFGPDVIASITTDELKFLCEGIRYVEKLNNNPVDKSILDDNAKSLRKIFMKSAFSTSEISAGETITEQMISWKKPGIGILANEAHQIFGKTSRKTIAANSLINLEDLE